jgi:hypothetical protein
MNRTTLLVLSLLVSSSIPALAATDQPEFELRGFKNVNFGMSPRDVAMWGYSCKTDPYSVPIPNAIYCDGNNTLFGSPAKVMISFKDNVVNTIYVKLDNDKYSDIVEKFTAALGRPKSYVYQSPGYPHPFTMVYWLSQNGTSIKINTTLTMGVQYQSVFQTNDMLTDEARSHDPGRDF